MVYYHLYRLYIVLFEIVHVCMFVKHRNSIIILYYAQLAAHDYIKYIQNTHLQEN